MKNFKSIFLSLSFLLLNGFAINLKANASPWTFIIPTILCPPLGIGMALGYNASKPYSSQEFINNVCTALNNSDQFNNELNVIGKYKPTSKTATIVNDLAKNMSIDKKGLKKYISQLRQNVDQLRSYQAAFKRKPKTIKVNDYNKALIDSLHELEDRINEKLPLLQKLLEVLKKNKALIAS